MKVNTFFGTYDVELDTSGRYQNGRVAVQLWEEDGPFATLSVNLPDEQIDDKENEFFVDVNNNPFAEQFLTENNIAVPLYRYARSGYCSYPLYRLVDTKGDDKDAE